jgi:nucleoside-diphosphate-sugar epimerase
MEVVIVRPPLVYGVNCPGNFLRLLSLIYKGLPLPLGTVNNHRNLISVHNLADFLVRCVEHPAAANKTFLIADDPDISTPNLIRTLATGMRRPFCLLPIPYKLVSAVAKLAGKQATLEKLCGNLQIDTSFARQTLELDQPMSLDEGLLEWGHRYRSYMAKNKT